MSRKCITVNHFSLPQWTIITNRIYFSDINFLPILRPRLKFHLIKFSGHPSLDSLFHKYIKILRNKNNYAIFDWVFTFQFFP